MSKMNLKRTIGNSKRFSVIEILYSVAILGLVYSCISFSSFGNKALKLHTLTRINHLINAAILKSDFNGHITFTQLKNKMKIQIIAGSRSQDQHTLYVDTQESCIDGTEIEPYKSITLHYIAYTIYTKHQKVLKITSGDLSQNINLPLYYQEELENNGIAYFYNDISQKN